MIMTDYEKAQDAAWRAFFFNNAKNFKDKELFKRSIIGCCHDFGAGLPKGADISWTYSKLLVANCLRCGLDIPMDAKEFLGAISERMGRIV
jgi:hypothetical protein